MSLGHKELGSVGAQWWLRNIWMHCRILSSSFIL